MCLCVGVFVVESTFRRDVLLTNIYFHYVLFRYFRTVFAALIRQKNPIWRNAFVTSHITMP